ncbi:hypothetical protein DL89DRAFT_61710 [Linderina pennispora]|uniref:SH3 domain-containing protein n=1 Tax=Linderina pennispora TaxID=61395 RepID=A0A1Y1W087_9FUNG|nr:uncharacterized protein DL89DRAFT_61710 [Linderina pennispora]ORX66929.1 hypothetical protein DL89DRAFT_61710 [Linderina pennispora]
MNFHGLEFDGVPIGQDVDGSDGESISSLIDEDVDFDHVYALFEFPAMVEGQVTVHDGEKLTLVDDSNSYWWLVSVERNGQVGYIPADNVETAREKLARVNRHKNLKLCMADPEHIVKSKMKTIPPLNARKVQFNNKLVTQVFVADPQSGDEYDEDDYSYDEESDEEVGEQRVDINGSRITMRYSMIDPSKGD